MKLASSTGFARPETASLATQPSATFAACQSSGACAQVMAGPVPSTRRVSVCFGALEPSSSMASNASTVVPSAVTSRSTTLSGDSVGSMTVAPSAE